MYIINDVLPHFPPLGDKTYTTRNKFNVKINLHKIRNLKNNCRNIVLLSFFILNLATPVEKNADFAYEFNTRFLRTFVISIQIKILVVAGLLVHLHTCRSVRH